MINQRGIGAIGIILAIFGFLIIGLGSGVGIGYYQDKILKKADTQIYNNKTQESTTTQQVISINDCNTIQVENDKNSCYVKVAIKEKDLTTCDNITNPVAIFPCYFRVIGANKDLPVSACDKVSDKDACYYHFATIRNLDIDKKDLSVCDLIQDSSSKDSCYLNVLAENKDINNCDNIKNYEDGRWFCYLIVAENSDDSKICNQIPIQAYKEKCLSELTK